MNKFITNSFDETQKIGFDFAKNLRGGEVLALYGDLGSGKTTFVQGLAQGLGITQRIISPTFIIMRSYVIPDLRPYEVGSALVVIRNPVYPPEADNEKLYASHALDSRLRGNDKEKGENVRTFYHVDLYRIGTEHDVEGLGLLELMGDRENIVAIEWPEKIENFLPQKRIDIYFTYKEDDKREIRFV